MSPSPSNDGHDLREGNQEKVAFTEDFFGETGNIPKSASEKLVEKFLNLWDKPVRFWREKVVLPNRQHKLKYYHQKFNRVPTIDECYEDDVVCLFEAHEQFKRDRSVDTMIVNILRNRWYECLRYNSHDLAEKCEPMREEYEENQTNWFIKYGDLLYNKDCRQAYYKQLHRMVWERRQQEKNNSL